MGLILSKNNTNDLVRMSALRPWTPQYLFTGGVQGAWFDPSDPNTLFSDRAGTTPCAAPGQGSVVPVGAMLDERATGYSVYFDGTGDYLSFASDSGLALGAGQYTVELWVYLTASVNFGVFFSVTGGLQFSTNASNNVAVALQGVAFQLESTTPVTLNQWVHLAVTRDSGNTTRIFLNGSQIASAVITTNYAQGVSYANFNVGLPSAFHTGYYANLRVVKGAAVYTGNFTPPTSPLSPITGTSLLTCGTSWSGNPAITKNGDARVDGLNPFQALPVGNHAIAANDTTARPELSARVNLLTYTEQFDNGAWAKDSCTISANATTAPDGTLTADKVVSAAATAATGVGQSIGTNSGQFTQSWFVKQAEVRYVQLLWSGGASSEYANFDLQTGVVTQTTAPVTPTISVAANGFYRITLTSTLASATVIAYCWAISTGTAGRGGTFAGNGVDGFFIWGADLRPANIGTTIPAYQRVADQYTYDTVGFPRYLAFNGTSSAMSTPANVNLSGTDKATVFAGVRKFNNTTQQFIVETSTNSNLNNGAFALLTNTNNAGGTVAGAYGGVFRGTSNAGYGATGTTAPISNVVTALGNIAAATDASILRVNGTQVATSGATSAGTGNFGTYPMYIASRQGIAPNLLEGHLYSLLVVGSAVSAGNISSTETWVNNKVGGAY